MEGDEVGLAKQAFKVHGVFYPGLRAAGTDEHLHSISGGNFCDAAPDAPVAEDSQDLALDFKEGLLPVDEIGRAHPVTRHNGVRVQLHVAGPLADKRKDQLGNPRRAVGGNVRHRHAVPPAGLKVYHVVAGRLYADVLERRAGRKDFFRDVHLVKQDRVAASNPPYDIGGLRPRVHRQAAQLLQSCP